MKIILAITFLCGILMGVNSQFFQPLVSSGLTFGVQPVLQQVEPSKRALQHRAVVLNSEAESRLPPQLQNPFYKNPRIEAALAKESWFTPGEQQVLQREADKIPREKIFSILKNAGLARRR